MTTKFERLLPNDSLLRHRLRKTIIQRRLRLRSLNVINRWTRRRQSGSPKGRCGRRRTFYGLMLALAASLTLLASPVYATATLETYNVTTDSVDGTNNYVYIGTTDRNTLYTYPLDNLSAITIKLKNATGYDCNSQTLDAYINAAETASDQTTFDISNGEEKEVQVLFTANPNIVLNTIEYVRFSISSCWSGLTYVHNSTNVWGADAGTYYAAAPEDPYIKIYGVPAWTFTVTEPSGDVGTHLIHFTAESSTIAYGPGYADFYIEHEIDIDDGGYVNVVNATWTWDGSLVDCGAFDCYAFDEYFPQSLPLGDYRHRVRAVVDQTAQGWSSYAYFTVYETVPGGGGGGGSWTVGEDLPPLDGQIAEPTCAVFRLFEQGDADEDDGIGCAGLWLRYWFVPTGSTLVELDNARLQISKRVPMIWVDTLTCSFVGQPIFAPNDACVVNRVFSITDTDCPDLFDDNFDYICDTRDAAKTMIASEGGLLNALFCLLLALASLMWSLNMGIRFADLIAQWGERDLGPLQEVGLGDIKHGRHLQKY